MESQLTDNARRVLVLANAEAQRFNHEYIGTEHLLLGLIADKSGGAARVLAKLKIAPSKLRAEIERMVQPGKEPIASGQLPMTPRARSSLELAAEEAQSLGHKHIGTEHILIGLLRQEEGVAAQVLMYAGAKLDDLRREVALLVGDGTAPLEQSSSAKQSVSFRASKAASAKAGGLYERFTDRARKTMQLANQEAQRFNHEYIGTEHILLGLIKEGSGVAANVLKNLEVDLRKIRVEVERLLLSGPPIVVKGKLPQTPRAKKVIDCAVEEALGLNHNYVGSEHILLGLLREGEGVAAQVLMNLGLKLDDVRQEVLNLLGHNEGVLNRQPPVQDFPTARNFWRRMVALVVEIFGPAAVFAIFAAIVLAVWAAYSWWVKR